MVHVSMYRLLFCSCRVLFQNSYVAIIRLACGSTPRAIALAYAFGTAYAHSHLLIATACELRTPMHSSAFAKRSSAKLI